MEVKKKIVIKIGSSTLTTTESKIDYEYLSRVANQVAQVRENGWQPIIVTSAAIACGLETLGIEKRPSDMPSLQAAASVGQSSLSTAYANAFAAHDMITSLVLLTRRETADRSAYLHARDTFERLLDLDVVPIVNENNTVSVEQISFGDNDTLAALVACMINADLLVVFSDVDGLYDGNPQKNPDAKLVSEVDTINKDILALAGEAGSVAGSGGMVTKIQAARVAMIAGIPMVICNGRKENVLLDAVEEKPVGTRFSTTHLRHEITPRKLWIALGDVAKGAVVVDEGAKKALIENGNSLLCVGLIGVEGSFSEGDIVDVKDKSGYMFARGRITTSSDMLRLAQGLSQETMKANKVLEGMAAGSAVHRDELVVFE